MGIFGKLFGGGKDEPLSVGGYMERYADHVRARYPDADPQIHPGPTPTESRVSWKMPLGTQANQYFGNWYARYLQNPGEIEQLLEEQLAEGLAVDRDLSGPLDPASILPVLKPADWEATVHRQLDPTDIRARFIVRPFTDDLVLTYVEDADESMSFVSPKALEEAGIDEGALHALAIENLTRFLPSIEIAGGGGRYAMRLDRNYDASMVLILDRWADRLATAGDPVIALPARDEVLICGSEDGETVDSMRAMAARIKEQAAYPLSDRLYVWRGGGLQPLA